MTSHGASPSPALALGNGNSALNKGIRRSSQVAPPQPFISDGAHAFFAEETPLDPQLQGSNGTESFSYYDYPQGSLTFGTGFGGDSSDAPIEIPSGDGTSYTVPASDAANLGLDAMSRFEKAPDPNPWIGPHSVEGMRGWKTTSQIIPRPQDAYSGYRNGPASDMGTSYSHVRNDSGYISRSYHESEHLSQQGDDTRSMIQQVEHTRMIAEGISLEFPSGMHMGIDVVNESGDADGTSSANNRMWPVQTHTPQRRCQHPECQGSRLMNPSEYKKHMQRHDKPFRCSVNGCKRSIDGFATPNDLQRHTKSVHNAPSSTANERSYVCKGYRCAHRSKVWPRLDNFKAHCKRRHRSEDLEDLVRRSAFDLKTKQFITDTKHERASAEVDRARNDTQSLGLSTSRSSALRETGTRTSLSPNSVQGANKELASTGMTTVPEKTAGASEKAHSHPLDAQAQTLQHAETKLGGDLTEEQCDPLAGLLPRNISQNDSQAWRAGLEELEKDLVNDFKAAQEGSAQPTPNELGAIATARIRDFFKTPRKRMASEAGLDVYDDAEQKQEPSVDSHDPSQARNVKCTVCGKEMGRLCDLKKHEKRHSRPWGCTDEKCNKTFGSKNDWKRHENSQHYQLESWRCHEPCESSLIGVCARTFFRQDPFRSHLRKEHGIGNETYMREQCRQRRIGKNWQDRFWCGFCRAIVKLQQKGLKAFDERFNHIDDYHFKKNQSIDLWYPIDKDVPKGQLRRQRNTRACETVVDGGSAQQVEDHEGFTDGSDDETDLSVEHRTSASPPPPPAPPPPEDLSEWSSPPRSFTEGSKTTATTSGPQAYQTSQPTSSGTSRRHLRMLSHEDSLSSNPRQASAELESEGKGHNARICRSCSAPINPEIDTSCPDCGIRLVSRRVEHPRT